MVPKSYFSPNKSYNAFRPFNFQAPFLVFFLYVYLYLYIGDTNIESQKIIYMVRNDVIEIDDEEEIQFLSPPKKWGFQGYM